MNTNKTLIEFRLGIVALIEYNYPLPFRIFFDSVYKEYVVNINGEQIRGEDNIKSYILTNYEKLSVVMPAVLKIEFMTVEYKKRALILMGHEYRAIQKAIEDLPPLVYTVDELWSHTMPSEY